MVKLRLKAIRACVWFRRLQKIDRVLFDLTIKVAKLRIYGAPLVCRLFAVASKLEEFLESKLSRLTRQIGLRLAHEISLIGQKWGHSAAKSWADDLKFARYLAVLQLNS